HFIPPIHSISFTTLLLFTPFKKKKKCFYNKYLSFVMLFNILQTTLQTTTRNTTMIKTITIMITTTTTTTMTTTTIMTLFFDMRHPLFIQQKHLILLLQQQRHFQLKMITVLLSLKNLMFHSQNLFPHRHLLQLLLYQIEFCLLCLKSLPLLPHPYFVIHLISSLSGIELISINQP
ncbi:uncharacterized protein BX663DRAFT_66660, partial [Cokeromyces recurvatus]|uniref:uncharacterized protein n=1 Tax=Cokeromyces recurvatus TaxID=90255 RepID=UPI00221FDF53